MVNLVDCNRLTCVYTDEDEAQHSLGLISTDVDSNCGSYNHNCSVPLTGYFCFESDLPLTGSSLPTSQYYSYSSTPLSSMPGSVTPPSSNVLVDATNRFSADSTTSASSSGNWSSNRESLDQMHSQPFKPNYYHPAGSNANLSPPPPPPPPQPMNGSAPYGIPEDRPVSKHQETVILITLEFGHSCPPVQSPIKKAVALSLFISLHPKPFPIDMNSLLKTQFMGVHNLIKAVF